MGIIGRLRRRDVAVETAPATPGEVAIDSFEYLRVGRTALTRVAGHWLADAPGPLDFILEVRVGGKQVDAVRALVEAPRGKAAKGPGALAWRAAFPTSVDAVEDAEAGFVLVAGEERIELEPPALRELQPGDGGWREDVESRIREAEAGLSWMQEQVHRERERRRALELELAALRAEREHALSPMVTAVEERYREVRYGLSRVRSASEETVTKLEEALESARAMAAMASGEPARHGAPESAAGATPCGDCDATGRCPSCKGSGRRLGRRCRDCAGSGGCRTCAGMGFVLEDDEL